jgi:eight-cysteine-cluster-containing protein
MVEPRNGCYPCECNFADCFPTVDPNDAYADRFEGIGLDNSCSDDADCQLGGCSGEICAAEIGDSTCEELPYLPTGSCGCVLGECIWHTGECPPTD